MASRGKNTQNVSENVLRFHFFIKGGCKAVSCFSQDGEYLCTYASASQGARAIKVPTNRILTNIEGERLTPKTGRRTLVGRMAWEWETDPARIANSKVIV